MKAYIVRLVKDKQFVGLFVCAGRDALAHLIDECCSPKDCEYAPLPAGSLLWESGDAPAIPVIPPKDVDAFHWPKHFERVDVCDDWHDHFFDNRARWKPVCSEFEDYLPVRGIFPIGENPATKLADKFR